MTSACNQPDDEMGFNITFVDVIYSNSDLPLLTSYTNNLQGLRRIDITEVVAGDATPSEAFRSSFRGQLTRDINVAASAALV